MNRRRVPNISQADMDDLQADMDDFAAALSRTCPLLERVHIRTKMPWSPAETYAMHFPNLKCLDLEAETTGPEYEHSRFDKLEASARGCVVAEELRLSCCTVSTALAERLIRTPLQSRIKCLLIEQAIIAQPTAATGGWLGSGGNAFPDSYLHMVPFTRLPGPGPPSSKNFTSTGALGNACAAITKFSARGAYHRQNIHFDPAVVDIVLRIRLPNSMLRVLHLPPPLGSTPHAQLSPVGAAYLRRIHGLTPLADGTDNGKNVDDPTWPSKEPPC